MASVTTTRWLVLSFALSCHAFAHPGKNKNSCDVSPDDFYRRVKGNYEIMSDSNGAEEPLYDCAPLTVSGKSFVFKCLNWKWTKCFPQCKRPISLISNAFHDDNRTSFAPGARVNYTCAIGYSHKGGNNIRTCSPKGLWTPLKMRCKSCGSAGEILNGKIIYTGTQFGHTATVVCDEGHLLMGKATRTCLSEGWDGRAASCEGKSCGSAGEILNGKIIYTGTQFGHTATVVCDEGHLLMGKATRTCLSEGWDGRAASCEGKSCGSAGEILNGKIIYTGTQFGHTATVVCDEGHLLVGKATRTCLSEGWDGRAASCEVVRCLEPETEAQIKRINTWQSSYKYRQVIRYRCNQGTLVGPAQIWCTQNGDWNAPPPVCRAEVSCPMPNVRHSSRTGARTPPFKYRATMRFQCDRGFKLVGAGTVACTREGAWKPPLPECTWSGFGR